MLNMTIIFIFFYFLFSTINSSVTYVGPISTNPIPANLCIPVGTKMCSGSAKSPWDNLSTAFEYALTMAGMTKDTNLTFNLITNTVGLIPLVPEDIYNLRSPFDVFSGTITIQGVQISNYNNPVKYVNSVATVYLSSEYFTFYINGTLNFIDIVISGIDMHMDAVPCTSRPDPALCTCASDTGSDIFLYDPTSVCSIIKPFVPNFASVYPGFIQLVGKNSTLNMNNFVFSNFNSFLRHIAFIYSSAANSTLNLTNFMIIQAYFAESFIRSDSANISFTLENVNLTNINEFYGHDLRTPYPIIFNFRNAKGNITIQNLLFSTNFTNTNTQTMMIFSFVDTNVTFSLTMFIIMDSDTDAVSAFTVFYTSNLNLISSVSTFILNSVAIGILHNTFECYSPIMLSASLCNFNYSSSFFLGPHSTLIFSDVYWVYNCLLCMPLYIQGSNMQVSIYDSFGIDLGRGFLSIDASNCTLNISNLTIILIYSAPIIDGNLIETSPNNFYINQFTLNVSYCPTSTVLSSGGSGNLILQNSNLMNMASYQGEAGAFLLLGLSFNLTLINVTITTSYSSGLGGIISTFGESLSNVVVTMVNCTFDGIITQIIGNIFLSNSTFIVDSCVFNNLSASVGGLSILMTSKITFINITLYNCLTELDSLIYTSESEVNITNSTFVGLSGSSACFLNTMYSTVVLDNVTISDSTCTNSLFIVSGSTISISNMNISNYTGGGILYFRIQAISTLLNIYIKNCLIVQNSVLFAGVTNNLTFTNCKIENVTCETDGATLLADTNNWLYFQNLTILSVYSEQSAVFYIFGNNSLIIENSYMNDTLSASTTGIFYVTLSTMSIKNSTFNSSNSQQDGLMSLNFSSVILENSSITNCHASKGASAIDAIKSNLSLYLVNFTNVYHIANSIDENNIMILIQNNENYYNTILINTCTFSNNGNELSNIMLSLLGVNNATISSSSFEVNSFITILSLSESNFFGSDLHFSNNSATSFIYVENSDPSNNLTFFSQNLTFKNNSATQLFSINGNISFNLSNLTINSTNQSKSSSLFVVDSINSMIIENVSCFNNYGSNYGYLFDFSNINSISLTQIKFSLNELLQFLQSSKSSLTMSFLEIQAHTIWELIVINSSSIIIENALFTNDLEIDLSQCSTTCYMKTLSISDCSLKLVNITFQNQQIKNDSLAQYELFILTGSSIELTNVSFINDYYQSIYAEDVQSINVQFSQFEILDSNWSYNGAIQIENTNVQFSILSFTDSQFINLKTQSNGSALSYQNLISDNSAIIEITNCTFSNNEALLGGALSFIGITNIIISKSLFTNNSANTIATQNLTGFGGSIYSKCLIENSCQMSFNGSYFYNNFADLGGGIFLENYGNPVFTNITFGENFAEMLGESNNSNMSSPHFLNMTYFHQENEQELFFDMFNQTDLIHVNNYKTIEMKFSISTINNLPCPYMNSPAIAVIGFLNQNINFMSSAVTIINGTIDIPSIIFNGQITENYSIAVTLENSSFYIQKTLLFSVRPCIIGEYLDSNLTCELCPYGSYNLLVPPNISNNTYYEQEGISVCLACPQNSECFGLTIAPNYNYWINSSNLTTKIVQCPIPGACFYQDLEDFEKPMTCVEGYTGPLCVTCQSGFSKDGYQSKCEKCQWKAYEVFMFIIKVFFMLIFVSFQISSVLFSKFKKDSQFSGTSVKIIRDHFNQIFLIYGFCSIFQIQDDYFTAYQSVNDVVTGTTLNFDCFYDEHYSFDRFYFKVLTFMISPFVLQVLISFIFFIFFIIKKFILKKKVMLKIYFKTILIAFIVICDTQYTQLLISFLKLFQCVQLDSTNPNTFLVYAPYIQCYSHDHIQKLLYIALPCAIFWIIGLPAIFFVVLYLLKKKNRNKRSLLAMVQDSRKTLIEKSTATMIAKPKEPKDKATKPIDEIPGIFEIDLDAALMLSFLFSDFSDHKYYWSSTILLWKAIISVFITFITDDSIYYVLFSFYVFLIWIYSEGIPYHNDSIMLLIKSSLMCNTVSIILGEYLNSEPLYQNAVVLINLLMHLSFFVLAVYLNIKEYDYQPIFEKMVTILRKKENSKVSTMVLGRLKKMKLYTTIEEKAKAETVHCDLANENDSQNSPSKLKLSSDRVTLTGNNKIEKTDTIDKEKEEQIEEEDKNNDMEIPSEEEHNSPVKI